MEKPQSQAWGCPRCLIYTPSPNTLPLPTQSIQGAGPFLRQEKVALRGPTGAALWRQWGGHLAAPQRLVA